MRSTDRATPPVAGARTAIACCAALLAVLALSACGGSKAGDVARPHSPAAAVAAEPAIGAAAVRVGRHSLTPATVEHWTRVEAALAYRYGPDFERRPTPPRGAIPDPPAYAACVAYLLASAKDHTSAAHPTRAALRDKCAKEHQALRQHVLEIVITDYWVEEEARAHDVVVRPRELQRLLDEEFADRRRFERFLAATGERASDERFILAGQLRLKKLQEEISPLKERTGHESAQTAARVDLAYQEYGRAMKRRWIPRTECRAGYVVVECREYRGPADTGGAPGSA